MQNVFLLSEPTSFWIYNQQKWIPLEGFLKDFNQSSNPPFLLANAFLYAHLFRNTHKPFPLEYILFWLRCRKVSSLFRVISFILLIMKFGLERRNHKIVVITLSVTDITSWNPTAVTWYSRKSGLTINLCKCICYAQFCFDLIRMKLVDFI